MITALAAGLGYSVVQAKKVTALILPRPRGRTETKNRKLSSGAIPRKEGSATFIRVEPCLEPARSGSNGEAAGLVEKDPNEELRPPTEKDPYTELGFPSVLLESARR